MTTALRVSLPPSNLTSPSLPAAAPIDVGGDEHLQHLRNNTIMSIKRHRWRPARHHHFARGSMRAWRQRRARYLCYAPDHEISATASRMLAASARPTSASEYPESHERGLVSEFAVQAS